MLDGVRIALVTTCKGRAQHIKQTLAQNLADNAAYPNVVFVLLDYGSQDDLKSYVAHAHRADIVDGRLVYYSFPQADVFRMAHAKNMAHRLGMLEGGELIVNLDADNLTGPNFAIWLAVQYKKHGAGTFWWGKMIPGVLPRGISGRIVVPRAAFVNAGGYDERFETWSHDDKDFNGRLRALGYVAREIEPRFLRGVRHNDKMRFREYPHARGRPYEEVQAVCGGSPVANAGRFGMGVVFRNFGRRPIELNAVPTRIFGIGLHKTGTTSLHQALGILGHDCAHWKNAHWARAIWEEMKSTGRSPTLERHYALTDLPIPLLYRELDRAYPGSKFILTVRDEGEWLASVERHFSREGNKFRAQWDSDPFTHRIHRELYGRRVFDREIFLERYRRHNAEVMEYFKGRGSDLIVMRPESGWERLCAFLRQKIPDVPYPRVRSADF